MSLEGIIRRTVNGIGLLSTLAVLACAGAGPIHPATAPPPANTSPIDDAALRQARALVDPRSAESPDALAAQYLQKVRDTGDPSYYPKAEALLTGALKQDPTDVEALIQMGALSLGQHQFQDALSWGTKARTLAPHSARPLGVVGDAQIELGRYDEAVATFQQMIDLHPDLGSYSRVSYARELHGDVPGAIEAMQQAVEAGGPVPENVGYARVLLGNLYFNSGRLADAETQYQEALAEYPGYVRARAGLASVLAARGDYRLAAALYQQVVNVYPAPEFVISLGDVYAAAGDVAKAKENYDLAAAEERLYQANGVDVDAELALFDAAHGRDLPQALDAARRAVRDRPSVISDDVLAWTLYQSGAYTEALSYEERAQRLGTQNALFFFHSGMIKARLGRPAEARADLAKAMSINPYFSVLHAAQARQTLTDLDTHAVVPSAESRSAITIPASSER
jgi:tetratricopeptide (TPR) repeat protein